MTAAGLLSTYEVREVGPDGQPVCAEMVDDLAAEIHTAERAAIESGHVLVKLDRPWLSFDELPEQAKAGRRRQADYLLGRFVFA